MSSPVPVSEEDLATIKSYCEKAQLRPDQLDALSNIWLDASPQEKPIIAQCYPQYFTDAHFVSKLSARGCARFAARSSGGGRDTHGTSRGSGGKNDSLALTQSRELRTALDSAVAKLSGEGPHCIQFGVVNSEEYNKMAIELYGTQFRYPDGPELARLVTIPRKLSTRTRKKHHGNFTWFIFCDATQEIGCAVSVNIHNASTFTFIEMPLFATNIGYKRLGFGRLLNAALQEHCAAIGAAFILVSADPGAVEFWCTPSLGYTPISTALKHKVEFHYANECSKFENSHLLTWEPPASIPQGSAGLGLVDAALSRMPNIVLKGPPRLPIP